MIIFGGATIRETEMIYNRRFLSVAIRHFDDYDSWQKTEPPDLPNINILYSIRSLIPFSIPFRPPSKSPCLLSSSFLILSIISASSFSSLRLVDIAGRFIKSGNSISNTVAIWKMLKTEALTQPRSISLI